MIQTGYFSIYAVGLLYTIVLLLYGSFTLVIKRHSNVLDIFGLISLALELLLFEKRCCFRR